VLAGGSVVEQVTMIAAGSAGQPWGAAGQLLQQLAGLAVCEPRCGHSVMVKR
jgi:hypothetical protein